jgi:hypothetical protein
MPLSRTLMSQSPETFCIAVISTRGGKLWERYWIESNEVLEHLTELQIVVKFDRQIAGDNLWFDIIQSTLNQSKIKHFVFNAQGETAAINRAE